MLRNTLKSTHEERREENANKKILPRTWQRRSDYALSMLRIRTQNIFRLGIPISPTGVLVAVIPDINDGVLN